jgi:hypothetical protein
LKEGVNLYSGRSEKSSYHFSKVMAEMVNCPHPQSLSQKRRKE